MTETERELLRSGKFDQLVEEQRRIDAERDAEVIALCSSQQLMVGIIYLVVIEPSV